MHKLGFRFMLSRRKVYR